ncbi:MAG: hypothetical protein ABII12_01600 [Planctomycetota bacterium]
MAKESSSFVGGILGVVIGVILIGGIAGTPFYLDMFMQEERAIDKAVEEDVDTIRRAALNLDQHLAAIQDVEGLLEDDQVVTGEIAAEVAAAHPDVFSDLMMQSLGKTASMLRRAQDQDQQRGVDSAVSIQTGQPNARACVQRMKTEYLAANQKLRRVAESSIQTLRPLQRGGKTATSRLAVARVHAVFYFAVGKMLANRAEFLHDQTSFLRRQANDELRKLAAVQRDLDVLDAESPLKALADLRERMLAIEGDESGLNERISLYTSAIESLTDRLGSLDVRATKAREEMAKSEAAGAFSEAGRSGEYLALASEARSAEAEATMVRNCLPQSLDSGETAAQDEGAQLGLRDLRLRLEQAETVLGAYREARADLEKREEMLTEQARVIADQQSTLTSQAAELLKEATRLVSEAGERAAAAEEAAGLAQAEFDRAATFAGHALRAAAGIKREAQTAS